MTRFLLVLVASLAAVSCTPIDYQVLKDSAASQVRQALAERFASEFDDTIDTVLGTLSTEGGFLQNPLVKILLPPPLGFVMAVGQAVAVNPEEALLEVLINHAAGEAIPVAGPLLKETLQTLVLDGRLDSLLWGSHESVTDALRAESGEMLKAALLPAIDKSLERTGAGKLFETLVTARKRREQLVDVIDTGRVLATIDEPADLEAVFGLDVVKKDVQLVDGELVQPLQVVRESTLSRLPEVGDEGLDDYIARQAVDGLFKVLAEKEQNIRAGIQVMDESWLNGIMVPSAKLAY